MILYGLPTDLSILLPLVATQLQTLGGTPPVVPPEKVFVTLEREANIDDDTVGDVMILICPTRFPIDQSTVIGGGAFLPPAVTPPVTTGENVEGEIQVTYYNRYEADYTHSDLEALVSATNGILKNWRLIQQSLQLFAPLDTVQTDWCLLSEPMKLQQFSIPQRQKDNPWLRIVSTWKMEFVQDLS